MQHGYTDFLVSLEAAVALLQKGESLLFPTETFFGIGCNACDPAALERIFQIKRRKHSLPLPVVVSSIAMVETLSGHIDSCAQELMRLFWPGPLSILLPARQSLPNLLTGGTGNVAVRLSSHPAVQALSAAFGGPLVASSANISGEAAVTDPAEINSELLSGAAGVYLDGPNPAGGMPSTILFVEDAAAKRVRIVREGALAAALLQDRGFTVAV